MLAPHTHAHKDVSHRHVKKEEIHRHGSMCVHRKHGPTALCVRIGGLDACPYVFIPLHSELPKEPLGQGLRLSFVWGPHPTQAL